jgi:hypothetical protein
MLSRRVYVSALFAFVIRNYTVLQYYSSVLCASVSLIQTFGAISEFEKLFTNIILYGRPKLVAFEISAVSSNVK